MNNGLTLCGMGTDGLSSAIFRAAGRLQRRGVEAAAAEPGFCSTGAIVPCRFAGKEGTEGPRFPYRAYMASTRFGGKPGSEE